MEFSFHIYNKLASDGISMAVEKLLILDGNCKTRGVSMRSRTKEGESNHENPPVIVCIGSDLAIGDSLGPIVGSMLKFKTQGLPIYLYGTLSAPITAKEVPYMHTFLKETHPSSQVIAIDAAIGGSGDIGLIRLNSAPLEPGAGANKQLGKLGDLSIMGVVAEKSVGNFGLLNTTRLNLVYTMAEQISDGLSALLWERCGRKKTQKGA